MAATITVVCPKCKNRMRASADYIGKRGRCPSCKALVDITPSAEESQRSVYPDSSGTLVSTQRSYKSTEEKGWLAAAIGIGTTVTLYGAIFYPLRSLYFGQLFVDRGYIPFVTTLFTCWGRRCWF